MATFGARFVMLSIFVTVLYMANVVMGQELDLSPLPAAQAGVGFAVPVCGTLLTFSILFSVGTLFLG
ncbi:hypothetical protein RND81_05G166400 [Saponaria officinalis]|uniref:Uncharacterized protein n=1 Tax=Saponaria officinalis TaxID=3572 RepID=A0AAW1KTS7_SAPOF